MNKGVRAYFGKRDVFAEVFDLKKEDAWEEMHKKVPSLPRGWYELMGLTSQDRIQLVSEFWAKKLPFLPHIDASIKYFFSLLDDLGVLIFKLKNEEEYIPTLIYSLGNKETFFHGCPPLLEEDRLKGIEQTLHAKLPDDFIAFSKIHDGFAKDGDTGIIPSNRLLETAKNVWEMIRQRKKEMTLHGESIKSEDLISFYKSYSKENYQCFYRLWYPYQEMGNVFIDIPENTISDFCHLGNAQEHLAFPTFLDWLIFYLETVD